MTANWKDWCGYLALRQSWLPSRLAREEEARIFVDGVRDDYRDLIEFMTITGLRVKQGLLRWPQYDGERIRVPVQKRTKGVSRLEWRTIRLAVRARELVEAQRGLHSEWVWTYEVRKRGAQEKAGERSPITASGFAQIWRRKARKAAAPGLRRHDLRHTAGTRMVRVRGLKAAKELLGHADIGATDRFYAHASEDDMLDNLQAVEDRYPPLPAQKSAQAEASPKKKQRNQERRALTCRSPKP